jgi:hypothetical protein
MICGASSIVQFPLYKLFKATSPPVTCNVSTGFITDSEKDEDETAYSSRGASTNRITKEREASQRTLDFGTRGASTNRITKEREASQRTLDFGTYEDEVMASLVRDVRTHQRLKTEEDLKRHNKRVQDLLPQAKSASKAAEASNQERNEQARKLTKKFGEEEAAAIMGMSDRLDRFKIFRSCSLE